MSLGLQSTRKKGDRLEYSYPAVYGLADVLQYDSSGKKIAEHLPLLEMERYCVTGLPKTMFAIKQAKRSSVKRPKFYFPGIVPTVFRDLGISGEIGVDFLTGYLESKRQLQIYDPGKHILP
jgi:hypothetical protein